MGGQQIQWELSTLPADACPRSAEGVADRWASELLFRYGLKGGGKLAGATCMTIRRH
eukprot:gene42127-11229_t